MPKPESFGSYPKSPLQLTTEEATVPPNGPLDMPKDPSLGAVEKTPDSPTESMAGDPRLEKISDGPESLSARGERIVKGASERVKGWGAKAGETMGRLAERGGAIFKAGKERWDAGVVALENGAYKLGQKMIEMEDKFNAGVDRMVNGVADAAKRTAELAGNFTRAAAEGARKAIEIGVGAAVETGLALVGLTAYAIERATSGFMNKMRALKMGALERLAKGGDWAAGQLFDRAKKATDFASRIRAGAGLEAPANSNVSKVEKMQDPTMEAMFDTGKWNPEAKTAEPAAEASPEPANEAEELPKAA